MVRVPTVRQGIRAAAAVLRIGGAGHSAVVHSNDARVVMEYAAAVDVLRVTVNAGGSTGSAGFDTGLAPSMTIGTGFTGRSSLGENLQPKHLLNHARIAYNSDVREVFPDFTGHRAVGRPATGHTAVPPGEQRPGRARVCTRSLGASSMGRPGRDPGGTTGQEERAPRGAAPADHRRAQRDREGLTTCRTGSDSAELRSFIFLDQLQPQTMCYLGTWIRGSLPRADMAAQIIEVAPGLDIEPLTDVALKNTDVQAGILVVERQFGYLEIHSRDTEAVRAAAGAVLDALDAKAGDATRPTILASRVVSRIDAQHAFLINRSKLGSMALPGESLFVMEMQPASYAILAANEAEKAARIKVVDYRMIGATGRVYLTGQEADVRAAAEAAELALTRRLERV